MELVAAKTILQRNKSLGWFGCEYNMNIYRGCCHGCLYCDSRSDCYHLEDFDRVRAKKDALRILRDDLARKAVKGVVATGAMSDPYNPFEAQHLLTRNALSLLDAYGFGVAIATKSDLVCRDADILRDIAVHSPVLCKITLTTVDDALAAKVEPGAPSPTRRLAACEELAKQGVFCGFLLMPVLPFIEDDEAAVLALVRRAAAAGARFIYPSFGVTMRAGQREYFLQGLDAAFPGEGYGSGTAATLATATFAPAQTPGSCGRLSLRPAPKPACCTRCRTSFALTARAAKPGSLAFCSAEHSFFICKAQGNPHKGNARRVYCNAAS